MKKQKYMVLSHEKINDGNITINGKVFETVNNSA